jgi:hypothetical protein
MRGSFGLGSILGVSLLGACQTIIGISRYEIDPNLDGAAGEASTTAEAGAGGAPSPDAAGAAGVAGESAAWGGAGGAPEPTPECATEDDCDDTIGCTVDACDDGVCTHAPERARCLPEAGECLDCRLGIGCVAVPAVVQELLLDPAFDEGKGEWTEHSDHHELNLFVEDGAQSGTRIARFGPSPTPATIEEYADLSQVITIPEHTSSLRLTGYYQLAPGTLKVSSDYAAAALYRLGEIEPASEFHSWQGTSGVQSEWQQFSYDAPRDEVLELRGAELTFDLIAHVYESVYRFDTLSLQATICE